MNDSQSPRGSCPTSVFTRCDLLKGQNASTVAEHYSNHLGSIYSWMVGDFDDACESTLRYFAEIDLKPIATGRAVDLGCGHGLQSIPLTKRGFRVTAIDNCGQLLDELTVNATGLPIEVVNDDLMNVSTHVTELVDVFVCMGDTITHLDSHDSVRRLICWISELLVADGLLCLSFRDYVTTELAGVDRFMPVRADDQRIHTCFLEYDSEHVKVHDIVHRRRDGGWETSTSAYRKLRILPGDVVQWASDKGLKVSHRTDRRGMVLLTFRRADR